MSDDNTRTDEQGIERCGNSGRAVDPMAALRASIEQAAVRRAQARAAIEALSRED